MKVLPEAKNLVLAVTVLASLASEAASAQEDAWDWTFTPYLWTAGIDGSASIGNAQANISLSFGDLVDILAGTALVHVEAHKSGYGLFGDLVYLGTEPTDDAQFDSLITEAGYLHKSPNMGDRTGWEIGIRYWDLDLELDRQTVSSVARGASWADGFIGYRKSTPLSDRWLSVARANIGAGGSDLSLGLDVTFLYEFSNSNQLALGFKFINVDYGTEIRNGLAFRLDTSFLGATIGYVFD